MPDDDIPYDDEGDHSGKIEYYMDNFFINFERYCKNTLDFDYHEIIVPQPKDID
jgi:hypothetical protein